VNESRPCFQTLLGNESIKRILSSELSAGKGNHAYILEGPAGSGKHTLARLIAASAVCEHRGDGSTPLPCGKCPSCRKILSSLSVDVLTVSNGDKASIGVDAVREIKESLYVTPNDGEKKFYLIENARLMTVQAQNALLLSLEEPPPFVMFFLLVDDASTLLETIRSRAPVLKLERFSADFTERYLTEKHPKEDREKIVTAAHLANGALGAAEEMLLHGETELALYRLAKELARVLLSPRKSEGILFLPSLPKSRQDTCRVLSLTKIALRDAVSSRKGGSLLFYGTAEGVPDYAKKISVKRLLDLIHSLTEAEDNIASNCSVTTVMTSLILNSRKVT